MRRGRAVLHFVAVHWYATSWAVLLIYGAAVYWFEPGPDGLVVRILTLPVSIAVLLALSPLFFRDPSPSPSQRREPSAIERGLGELFSAFGGCLAALLVVALMLAGLVFFLWLVKRIWEVV